MTKLESLLEKNTLAQKLINEKHTFDPHQLPELLKYYKNELTWSSNALEGNSISLIETQMILEHGVTLHGHTLNEIHECIGHGKAVEYMFSLINQTFISEENIKTLHNIFKKNIEGIPCPGQYRNESKTNVYISGSNYECPRYDKVPNLMEELVDWCNSVRKDYHPIELAAELHRRFVYIHPFPDGNGRIARLIMNTILLQTHYMPLLISPTTRKSYVRILENGRIDTTSFDVFISKQELKQQLKFMKFLSIDIPENLKK